MHTLVRCTLVPCLACLALATFACSLFAQETRSTPVEISEENVVQQGESAEQPDAKAPQAGQPQADQKNEKPNSKTNAAENSTEPKVIRRGQDSSIEGNPDELTETVGEDGRVAFQFRNQGWVELVQWLADISDQPLDWLELPADRVNMRSPGRYTVEQTRDLFNRHLLARGYTLLEIDGGLTVAKTETINPAMVPRVEGDQLADLPPHTFVRTSLDVGWLSAEKLAAELAPMISANGKLTALTTTNRIEAMDAAINLRQVAKLLEQELDVDSMEALAPEFKLRFMPAEEAKRLLEQFLGVEKKSNTPLTPQQMQMMQQMQNQNPNAMAAAKPKIEIAIVANTRQNSVIIRAPTDRVAAAMQFLKRIDMPSDAIVSLADIQTRVQVFRLTSLDPEKLIEIVSDMNILEPTTRVSIDVENNALIVSGSAADRFVIDSLIKRLDGSGRQFEVLQLRRLNPVEVAESIAFLMGQKEDNNKNDQLRNYMYGYYGNRQEKKREKDKFRVAANSRYRQILLWANEWELEEVQSLLVKLGEFPPSGGDQRTMRVIDASATPETYDYLQRLKEQWNRLSPNQLELPAQESFKDPNERPSQSNQPDADAARTENKETDQRDDKTDDSDKKEQGAPDDATLAQIATDPAVHFTVTQQDDTPTVDDRILGSDPQRARPNPLPPIRSSRDFERAFGPAQPEENQQRNEGNAAPAAIRIEIDSDGNLVLVSPDVAALDRLENLMLQITPPKRPYQVFHIEHATAAWMRLNLKDYFEDDEDSEGLDPFEMMFWGFDIPTKETPTPAGLGKNTKLRFIDDPDTNTLVVSGATNEQLRTISELIKLWDVPEPVNKRKTRFTKLVSIAYGKADQIAETIKDAYRDLLSSNDRAFAKGGQNPGGRGGGDNDQANKSRDGNGSGLQSETGQDGGGADFSFKGKLSIGVDHVGNTLLISAEGEPLLNLVVDIVKQLDEAARPQGEVQVIELPGGISARGLQNALRPLGIEAEVTPLSRPAAGSTNPQKQRSEVGGNAQPSP